MSTVEQRLARLEDHQQITALTMQLARHFDNNYHADGVVSLFTDDGVFDGGPFGRHEGVEAIHGFFTGVSEQITFQQAPPLHPSRRAGRRRRGGNRLLVHVGHPHHRR